MSDSVRLAICWSEEDVKESESREQESADESQGQQGESGARRQEKESPQTGSSIELQATLTRGKRSSGWAEGVPGGVVHKMAVRARRHEGFWDGARSGLRKMQRDDEMRRGG